jgi:hypothetical protein
MTTTTRICLDVLTSARARREEYVGSWLPDPVVDTAALAPDSRTELGRGFVHRAALDARSAIGARASSLPAVARERRARGDGWRLLPPHGAIIGVVLADHVKNLDWEARRVVFEAKAPAEVLTRVVTTSADSLLDLREGFSQNLGAPRRVIVHARLLPYTRLEVCASLLSSVVKSETSKRTVWNMVVLADVPADLAGKSHSAL